MNDRAVLLVISIFEVKTPMEGILICACTQTYADSFTDHVRGIMRLNQTQNYLVETKRDSLLLLQQLVSRTLSDIFDIFCICSRIYSLRQLCNSFNFLYIACLCWLTDRLARSLLLSRVILKFR